MIGIISALGLLMGGYCFIFSGIAFSNKRLFPDLFDSIYESTGFFTRIVIFSILFCIPGNYMIAKSFQVTSPSIAGMLLIGTVLIISVVNAMILDKVHMNWQILGAILGALFFCGLTAWLLEGQRSVG